MPQGAMVHAKYRKCCYFCFTLIYALWLRLEARIGIFQSDDASAGQTPVIIIFVQLSACYRLVSFIGQLVSVCLFCLMIEKYLLMIDPSYDNDDAQIREVCLSRIVAPAVMKYEPLHSTIINKH